MTIELELSRIATALEKIAGSPVAAPAVNAPTAVVEAPAPKSSRAAKALADALKPEAPKIEAPKQVPVVEADPFEEAPASAPAPPTRDEVMNALKAAAKRVGQAPAQALLKEITGSEILMPSVVDGKPNPKLAGYLAEHGAKVIAAANALTK